MTYPLTPRQDRLRVLRARRDQLDALIRRLEEAEHSDHPAAEEHPPCGSDRGYSYHRRQGEDACEECKEAHRFMERLRYARRHKQEASV